MADSEKKKAGPPRIALGDYKSARHSLARILRMYFRKELDTEHFRNLCYGLNILLSYDKFEKESELENKRGGQSDITFMTPDERERRILELMQKAGYVKAEKPIPQADAPPDPDPVPVILESPELLEQPQPEQPQPRMLKL
jgi:hypothetical protein